MNKKPTAFMTVALVLIDITVTTLPAQMKHDPTAP